MEENTPTKEKKSLSLIFYAFITLLLLAICAGFKSDIDRLEGKIGLDPTPAVAALNENKKIRQDIFILQNKYQELEYKYNGIKDDYDALYLKHLTHLNEHMYPSNETTIYYDSDSYSLIETKYAPIAVYLADSKPSRNGIELTFGLLNSSLFYFSDAKVQITINDTTEERTITLSPKKNLVSLLFSPIKSEDIHEIKIKLVLNKMYLQQTKN